MAALAARSKQPVLVPRRGPALVSEGGGMFNPGDRSAALAAADPAQVALAQGQGGAARGGALIDQPRQPDVLGGDEGGGGGGPDIGTLLALIGKSAGKAGPSGPLSGPTDDGMGNHLNGGTDRSEGGLLDKIKSLFLGEKKKPEIAAAQVQAPDITPGALDPNSLGALDLDAPHPTARPVQPGEEPYQVGPGAAFQHQVQAPSGAGALNLGRLNMQGPALPAAEPGLFDRIRADPMRMFLLTGGLGTMAAASRRGATPLGALGEGALGGVHGVFEQEAAQSQRDLDTRRQDTADKREADEEILRGKQGAFYDARTAAEPEKTAAGTTRAGAAMTGAAARAKSADASMVRADAYAKAEKEGKGSKDTAFRQKQQAWLAANPGDAQGALNYAGGHATMSSSQKYLAARRLATSQLNGMIEQPEDADGFLDQATNTILSRMDSNEASQAPSGGKGGSGPALGGPAPPKNLGALRSQALDAIKRGGDQAKVKARFKKLTGKDADF